MSGIIKGTGYTQDNPAPVEIPAHISTLNSTTATLGVGGVFTGSAERINGYGIIYVNTYSDQASAVDGLQIEQSSDGTNWDHCDEFSVQAASGKNFSINPHAQWLRVIYTNGVIAQTEFRLQTILKANGRPSAHRIQDDITSDDDAELVKAVITGHAPDGHFHNVNVTHDGDLSISDNSSGLSISEGNVTGKSFEHKFGNAPDFDFTDGEVYVWDGADDSNDNIMTYTFSTSADIDRLSSSSAGDTQDIEVQGLDSSYNLVLQTITLTGQTPVALTTSLIRVFRLKNVGSTDIAGRVYCFVNGATSGGVPNTSADIRAIIENGNNQTEMAIYTVPAGKTAYVRDWFASSAGANKSTNIIMMFKVRPLGQVFQLKHRMAWDGSIPYQHDYKEPEKYIEKQTS